jgi:hypothetical protein
MAASFPALVSGTAAALAAIVGFAHLAISPACASEAVQGLNAAAPAHLPFFITSPGETDGLMVAMVVLLVGAVAGIGVLFLRIHSLPERMAHKSQKLQFEIVAVLCLLALFTHIHLFWVAALLLALIDLPDFATPLGRIAAAAERLAGRRSPPDLVDEEAASPPAEAPLTPPIELRTTREGA